MKKNVFYLAIVLLLSSQIICAQNMQKEIENTIEAMIKCSIDKDLEKSMSFWLDSEDFVLITDGHITNFAQLKEMLKQFWANLEKQEVLKNSVQVTPLSKYKALCVWKGTESIKMKDSEAIESNWISTLVMENKKGGWVILHGHTSHF